MCIKKYDNEVIKKTKKCKLCTEYSISVKRKCKKTALALRKAIYKNKKSEQNNIYINKKARIM